MPRPSTFMQRIGQPELLIEAVRNAHIEPRLLRVGAGTGSLGRVILPTLCLDFTTLTSTFHFTGAMPPNNFTLLFVLECQEPGYAFNFSTSHVGGYIGFYAPGGPIDAVTPAGYSSATLTVPVASFRASLDRWFPEIPEPIVRSGAGLRIDLAAQARLRTLLAAVSASGDLPDDLTGSLAARTQLEAELLEAFMVTLRSGCDQFGPTRTCRAGGRHRKLRRARDFMADHAAEIIGLEELSHSAGLSHRGLENLFRDFIGLSPMAYLRNHRLQLTRRALLAEKPDSGVVKRVALDAGFWHLGRFAGDYRALFGESPGETLRR